MVAGWFASRFCFQSRRSLVHRRLHERFDSDRLSVAIYWPRLKPALVTRRKAHRLRAATRKRRRAGTDPRTTSADVVHLDRRRRDRRGKSTLEESFHIARLASIDPRRNEPALGSRRPHRLSLLSRRPTASLLNFRKRWRAVAADARQLHGGVHLDQRRSHVHGLRRKRRFRS